MGKLVADIIVETLQNAGVKHCYGVALGLWGETVSSADQLEAAVKDWLAQPGPAFLHVHVNPMQLVMPPFMQAEPAIGMALYSTRAILHGRRGDVWEMVRENFL
jgi:pyruvate dehydrogenase (quinone)